MKKIILVFFALLLTVGSVSAYGLFDEIAAKTPVAEEPAPSEGYSEEGDYQVVERTYPFYLGSVEAEWEDPYPLYFINGVDDLPYVDLRSWMDVIYTIYSYYLEDPGYDLGMKWDGPKVTWTRENGYRMDFDFDADTITFDDYNGFLHNSGESALLDVLSESGFNEAGESELFQRNLQTSYDRYGDILKLDLTAYGIKIIAKNGYYLVPLQTMSDILVSPGTLQIMLFNGNSLIMGTNKGLGNIYDGFTPLGEIYYSGKTGNRSKELADFGYRELCFALDNLYGLKDSHDIHNFDQIFWQIGYDNYLVDEDPYLADEILFNFIDDHLDDLHSSFLSYSYLTGAREVAEESGPANRKIDAAVERYRYARYESYPDGYMSYEEIGNTAYVTFDNFVMKDYARAYYEAESTEDMPDDTISLIIYAHQQITREDSPIENVVLDLSNNLGGDVDAGIFVMGWFLGDAPFSVKNTLTGAMSTATYRADVNLDRVFDEKDTVADKNLYCLISPVSFSCGNLVPAALKSSGIVTLLGRTSGGGSCTVQPLSTAWGTLFQISGPTRMSFLKNGSFYDIDQGIDPDYTISKPENYYNREKLTEYINENVF